MKSLNLILKLSFISILFFSAQSMVIEDGVVGTWAYEAEYAPYPYDKGDIIITSEEDAYKAEISINGSKMAGKEVAVVDNLVSFNIYVEGTKVAISIMIDGDTFKGKAVSYEGTFNLTGKRK